LFRDHAQQPVLHFLHVSKTGGTAIKHALRPYLTAGRFAIKLHPHKVTLAQVPSGEKFFFFLREPVSRFVSGFYSRQRQGRPRIHVPWTAGEQRAFARFRTANELALALSSNDMQIRNAAGEAMRKIAHARRTFDCWFGSDADFLRRIDDVLFIGFQEQLAEDFEILKRVLDVPQKAALPADDIAAHRNPTTVDKDLVAEARDNLLSWFAKDRQFLELCRFIRRSHCERGLDRRDGANANHCVSSKGAAPA
jgi:hypothetical protein